jgi:LuxR family transcriptional regulator, maltose regulon positive regulatory protein
VAMGLRGPAGLRLAGRSADADDPVALLAYIAQALHLLDGHVLSGPLESESYLTAVALPRLGAAMHRTEQPFVLVLDDTHRLRSSAAWNVLASVVNQIPRGSHLVLSGRAQPGVPLGGLNAHRDLLHLDTADLAMDQSEGEALLQEVNPRLTSDDRTAILTSADGWPAAMFLAGATSDGGPGTEPARHLDGADVLTRYVAEELLDPIPAEIRQFLTHTSILPTLTTTLCDAVLEQTSSGPILDRIHHDHLLIAPADGQPHSYRRHRLVTQSLRSTLNDKEPDLVPLLHRRAAEWHRRHGDLGEAIQHSLAAGDLRRSAELIWISSAAQLTSGRRRTVENWLTRFTVQQLLADPLLALTAAWCALLAGRSVELWLAAAERGPQTEERNLPADSTSITASTALLRAMLAADGPLQMGTDAERAAELVSTGDPSRAFAAYLAGVAHHLCGNPVAASERLQEGQHLSALLSLPTTEAACSAQLALLAHRDGDWARAGQLAAHASDIVKEFSLNDVVTMMPVHTASALTLAQHRRVEEAQHSAARAKSILAAVAPVLAWQGIQTRTMLARTHLLLGEPAPARLLLSEAEQASGSFEAPGLRQNLNEVWEMVHTTALTTHLGRSSVTTAELKVLQLLHTHLSFQEIGDSLHLSRNTVKTQAISVYRKLGVGSRSEAVQQAQILGLSNEPPTENQAQEARPDRDPGCDGPVDIIWLPRRRSTVRGDR